MWGAKRNVAFFYLFCGVAGSHSRLVTVLVCISKLSLAEALPSGQERGMEEIIHSAIGLEIIRK